MKNDQILWLEGENLLDRITINLHFFLEKRAIFLIFHCKHQR